jgi:hypothetical protein
VAMLRADTVETLIDIMDGLNVKYNTIWN